MTESISVHNSHNVSGPVCRFVCPAEYRRAAVTERVEDGLKQTCARIELRCDRMTLLETGADRDHVRFLIQSTPNDSPGKIISTVKSITAKSVSVEHPEVKRHLWGGAFRSWRYCAAGAGKDRSEYAVRQYVKQQSEQEDYEQLRLWLQLPG